MSRNSKTRQPIIRRPAVWQTDPSMVTSRNVQFWHKGMMVTAQMAKAWAQEKVRNGEAFVINQQAIGALINGSMES